MNDRKPVSLLQLANNLGFHRNSIKSAVLTRGFCPFRLKDCKNSALYLSYDDSEQFSNRILMERSNTYRQDDNAKDNQLGLSGVYIIEVPSYESINRLKIGWSDNIEKRFSDYRTIIPDLRIRAIFPSMHPWIENMILLWSEHNGKRISQEVFEFSCNDSALVSIEILFSEFGIQSIKNLPF